MNNTENNPASGCALERRLCQRGHARTGNNLTKWGQCKECAKLIRRHPRIRLEFCKNGHEMTPSNSGDRNRCLKCCDHVRPKKIREELRDSYVRSCLKLPKDKVTKELLELTRANVKLKREIVKCKQ